MSAVEANGRVTRKGRLVINETELAAFLNEVSGLAGKEVTVTVRAVGKPRSRWQNNYYYGCVVSLVRTALSEEWGERMTKDETHALLKQVCNWKEYASESTGETVKVPQSTASLSTLEFEEYLERCRRFAAEFLNLEIPLPNEQIQMEFTENTNQSKI